MNEVPFDVKAYEKIFPIATIPWREKDIKYYVPTSVAMWRAGTFHTKEPDTIEWLSTFKPGEVYFDIGANVGMYAIAAAVGMDVDVYAFEPEASNFWILTRNIYTNNICDKIKAYCIALTDETKFGDFFLSTMDPGQACHMFGESLDVHLRPKTPGLVQGCVSFSLDELIHKYEFPIPNHIKIDVDGWEHKILDGGVETIANDTVASVLVELNINLEVHRDIISRMENYGFSFDQDQVDTHMQVEGHHAGIGNYIFRR